MNRFDRPSLSLRQRLLLLLTLALAWPCLLATAVGVETTASATNLEAIEQRLSDSVRYLSSDELEGRGIGTAGLDEAADYIARQFKALGLKTDLYDGTPFQSFEVTTSAKLGPKKQNHLRLVHDEETIDLQLGEDFRPLAAGGSGAFDLPLVFAGYGITAKDLEYDDYAGLDVKGKAVVILRHEPQQNNPHSVFDGTKPSQHALFRRKISNAFEHGAAAIIFVTTETDLQSQRQQVEKRWQVEVDDLAKAHADFQKLKDPTPDQVAAYRVEVNRRARQIDKFAQQLDHLADPVLEFERAGQSDGRTIPIVHARRGVVDKLVQSALGKSLSELERQIDQGPQPASAALAGWTAQGETAIERERAEIKNVVAVLEGEGPKSDEVIVVAAHYDHLGYGGEASRSPGSNEVHNGADDNGSGTAALIEIARNLTALDKKLPRTIVFIAFTGEERGLLGSDYYVSNPLFPLERTVAMLNMDMVGRLQDDKLIINGTGTAEEFDGLIKRLNAQHGFKLTKSEDGFGPSDHASFYARKIPVLHFFTGAHEDYHRPSDVFEKINVPGIRRIAAMVADFTTEIASAEAAPTYQEIERTAVAGRGGSRPYFGSIPNFSQEGEGYGISGVAGDSPAGRGGLKGGDVIIQFGESRIGNLEDFDSALRKYEAGDKVPVVVRRDGEQVKLEVTLDPPR